MSDRVVRFVFDEPGQYPAGVALTKLLRECGFDALFTSVVITVPVEEVERLREWQRREPERFGGC